MEHYTDIMIDNECSTPCKYRRLDENRAQEEFERHVRAFWKEMDSREYDAKATSLVMSDDRSKIDLCEFTSMQDEMNEVSDYRKDEVVSDIEVLETYYRHMKDFILTLAPMMDMPDYDELGGFVYVCHDEDGNTIAPGVRVEAPIWNMDYHPFSSGYPIRSYNYTMSFYMRKGSIQYDLGKCIPIRIESLHVPSMRLRRPGGFMYSLVPSVMERLKADVPNEYYDALARYKKLPHEFSYPMTPLAEPEWDDPTFVWRSQNGTDRNVERLNGLLWSFATDDLCMDPTKARICRMEHDGSATPNGEADSKDLT